MAPSLITQQAEGFSRRTLNGAYAVAIGLGAAFAASLVFAANADRESAVTAAFTAPPILFLAMLGAIIASWRNLAALVGRSERAVIDAHSALRDMGDTDALTGLANRSALSARLNAALEHAARARTKFALLLVDLDEFKRVNDAHGLLVGDMALQEASRRISGALRNGEFCARCDGDEFAVLVESASEDRVRRLAQSLLEALCQPMQLLEIETSVSASVGVAIYPDVARNESDLLRKAGLAVARAQRGDRGAVRVYDLSMEAELAQRERLEADLHAAAAAGQLAAWYQPIINLRTCDACGLEILARWRHPERGLIMPREFLPLADASGLMNEVTAAVLRDACRAVRTMPGVPGLSLNVAPSQVQSNWLIDKLGEILAETSFPASRLTIDITASSLLADMGAAKRVITALKRMGVRVALDDFGVGYASLAYLAELPIDVVKIDASFLRRLGDSVEAAKIVAAIVALAKSLGAQSLAEGVETADQATWLKTIGCDAAQGYYFARPMSAPDAANFFAAAAAPAPIAIRA